MTFKDSIIDKNNLFEIKVPPAVIYNDDEETNKKQADKLYSELGVPHYTSYEYSFCWYKVNDEWYYFKSNNYNAVNELLGEIISEYYDLDTIKYHVAKLYENNGKETYGIVSKNFCNPKYKYKNAAEYGFDIRYPKDFDFYSRVRSICKNDDEYKNLLQEIKKLFIRDFYTQERDRYNANLLFKESENGISLAPLFDYECSFFSTSPNGVYANNIGYLDINNEETKKKLRDDNYFQELLDKLLSSDMNKFVKEVEDRHGIIVEDRDKDFFKKHDKNIKALVKENKVKK